MKNEVLSMVFQKTQMCRNERPYVTVHSAINIMTSNREKGLTKSRKNVSGIFLLITCWKRVIFIYHLFEKGYYKHTMRKVGVWLSY